MGEKIKRIKADSGKLTCEKRSPSEKQCPFLDTTWGQGKCTCSDIYSCTRPPLLSTNHLGYFLKSKKCLKASK